MNNDKSTKPAITISALSKTYANGHKALHNIDLTVKDGDFFALLGPNGAGKSTTIRIISSLTNKSSGSINIYGIDTDDNFALAKTYLGIVPQEFNFSSFETPWQIVTNQAGFYGMTTKAAAKSAEQLLKQLDLWQKRHDKSQTLSGGMKRRLMIARALVHQPKLLILDEPTAGVDIEIRRGMWEFLKKINSEGTTIILTTHYLEEAENLCRNIAIIDDGVVIKNTSMKSLINTLADETYVLDLNDPLSELPRDLSKGQYSLIDNQTVEVTVAKTSGISPIFEELSSHKIEVSSMRNKSNRLEELFLKLVKKT